MIKNDKDGLKKEILSDFGQKSLLDQALAAGRGDMDLYREERDRFLGELRERVIKVLTYQEALEPQVYPEIEKALKDPRAKKLVAQSKIPIEKLEKYLKIAQKHGIPFVAVNSPDFEGETGLVVASDTAVDVKEIFVPTRKQRLLEAGVPEKIIDAVGKPLCSDCMAMLQEKAPDEAANYKTLGFLDRMMGEECMGCKED